MQIIYDENNYPVDFDYAVSLMDEELRERIHADFSPCSPQYFFNHYVTAHYMEFGERFETI